jgi:hypothetical protein
VENLHFFYNKIKFKGDFMKKQEATVNMDDKQRICLTRVLSKEERENFNRFRIYRQKGKIVLEPVVEVPAKDHWIYKDPKALASLMKGIKDVEEGRLYDLGSFAKYAKEDKNEK